MAAWRYEISLLVLKKYFTRSLCSLMKYFSTLEGKFCISAQPCNILYTFYKHIEAEICEILRKSLRINYRLRL